AGVQRHPLPRQRHPHPERSVWLCTVGQASGADGFLRRGKGRQMHSSPALKPLRALSHLCTQTTLLDILAHKTMEVRAFLACVERRRRDCNKQFLNRALSRGASHSMDKSSTSENLAR